MTRTRKPLIILLLGIFGLLVLTLAVLVAMIVQQRADTATAKAPTPAPTLTPTPVLPISPAQGWVKAQPTLAFARRVAFGINDPLTGYTCGSQGIGDGQGTPSGAPIKLQFSHTTDGGRTWQTPQTLPFGTNYSGCELQVDPANAKDILIARVVNCDVGPCWDQGIPGWYRSRDGGQTWNPLTFPASVTAIKQQGFQIEQQFSWDGATLYDVVNSFTAGTFVSFPDPVLLVDKGNGTFIDFSSPTFNTVINLNLSHSLIPIIRTPVVIGNGSLSVFLDNLHAFLGVSTHDGGATWTPFTPTLSGAPLDVSFRLMARTGTTLYGSVPQDPKSDNGPTLLIQSLDGGQTWSPLSVQPPGVFANDANPGSFSGGDALFIPPDGTLYLNLTGPMSSIVALAPNATAWQTITTEDAQSSPYHILRAVSWDKLGHTVALWGDTVPTITTTDIVPEPIQIPTGFILSYRAAVPGN